MICPTCGFDNLAGEDHCTHCHTDLRDLDVPAPTEGVPRSILEDALEILCTHPPTTVSADTPLREVLRLMRTKRIGSVVIGKEAPLAGIFTERDFLYQVAGKDVDLDRTTVGSLMTPNPVTVLADQPIVRALYAMSTIGVRHVPLMKDGKLIEILSVHDVLNYLHDVATGRRRSPSAG